MEFGFICFVFFHLIMVSSSLPKDGIVSSLSRTPREASSESGDLKSFGNVTHNTTEIGKEELLNHRHFWLLRVDDNTKASTVIADSTTESTVTDIDTNINTECLYLEEHTKIEETDRQDLLNDPVRIPVEEMSEIIFLNRNNCNTELQIKESEDRKVRIQYENLKNGMAGQCQVALYGEKNIMLAVLITNVNLNIRKSRKSGISEVLRVISRNANFNFTLKEYFGNDLYNPVILTESNQVYLVLNYNATNALNAKSGFDLEVFNYHKKQNQLNVTLQDQPGYGNTGADVENIFITTSLP